MICNYTYGNITACTTTMPNLEISLYPLTEKYEKNVNLSVEIGNSVKACITPRQIVIFIIALLIMYL